VHPLAPAGCAFPQSGEEGYANLRSDSELGHGSPCGPDPRRTKAILEYSSLDGIPVALGLVHFDLLIGIFIAVPYTSWPLWPAAGTLYALSIAWSINSVSHTFVHNLFFLQLEVAQQRLRRRASRPTGAAMDEDA
jgi:hypothetical protein